MITARDLIIDQFAPTVESDKRLTTWYAQGHSDGLGDRLLMFDNTNAPSWEILRFKPTLARDAKFEAAVRQRVERLTSFDHAAFPLVRPIKKLGQEDGLAVVSTYTSGVSLSEALKKPRSAAFSLRLIRQLVPALAALHQHAPGDAHGALNADRIILTAEGRLMIREHMVGTAIETLELSAARLWAEFGILTPPTSATTPALDDRSDITQLAIVALSLMAGRRIGPDEYPAKIRELLDEIARRSIWHGPVMFQSLSRWLERALQIGDEPFDSARQANDALAELQGEPERDDDQFEATLRQVSQASAGPFPQLIGSNETASNETASNEPASNNVAAQEDSPAPLAAASVPVLSIWYRLPPVIRWAAVAVGALALVEAAFIGRLLYSGSSAGAAVETKAVSASQPHLIVPTAAQPSLSTLPIVDAAAKVDSKAPDIRPATAAEKQALAKLMGRLPDPVPAVAVKSGGFRVAAPIEVHVLEGERVVGSSVEGPIIASAGRHEFDFVNSVIGYRARRVVDVKAGQITSLSVPVPNGSLNVNAVPWAAVFIDGMSYGETPLGNLSIVPGEHEIVFRHPQLGERREKTIVRADGPTRVAVNLQR